MNTLLRDIGVRSFFRQVMTCGFFHADPHPGNIFVMDDMRLAYIDFGMVGLIDDKTLGQLNQLILAATDKNVDKIIRILADMGAISKSSNDEGLKRDLLYLVHYYFDSYTRQDNDYPRGDVKGAIQGVFS